jgi:hypothetical protein
MKFKKYSSANLWGNDKEKAGTEVPATRRQGKFYIIPRWEADPKPPYCSGDVVIYNGRIATVGELGRISAAIKFRDGGTAYVFQRELRKPNGIEYLKHRHDL